jgi:gliding motility-associated-like protein
VAAIPNPNFYADFNPTDYFHTDLNLIMIYPNPTSTYSWEMPDGIPSFSTEYGSTRVKYPEFEVGTYEVTLTEFSSFGCEKTVTHLIQVLEDEMLFAPTAFTPNGDPYNPDWGVHVEGFLPGEFSLMVFNQWGEIVWQTTDPNARWDGTYLNGVLAPSDLYVWYIIARDQINDEIFEFTGYVTLNR